jgi:hypothetical protein
MLGTSQDTNSIASHQRFSDLRTISSRLDLRATRMSGYNQLVLGMTFFYPLIGVLNPQSPKITIISFSPRLIRPVSFWMTSEREADDRRESLSADNRSTRGNGKDG